MNKALEHNLKVFGWLYVVMSTAFLTTCIALALFGNVVNTYFASIVYIFVAIVIAKMMSPLLPKKEVI